MRGSGDYDHIRPIVNEAEPTMMRRSLVGGCRRPPASRNRNHGLGKFQRDQEG